MNHLPGAALRLPAMVACTALVAVACVTGAGASPTTIATISSSGSVAPTQASTSEPTGIGSVVPTPVGPTSTAELSEVNNGRTLAVSVGATVTLVLHNTYWTVQGSSNPSVLAPLGQPVYSGAGSVKCIPGTGCGTVTATFKAVAQGNSVVSASRTSCGDAIQCPGGAGTFEVTVVVVP